MAKERIRDGTSEWIWSCDQYDTNAIGKTDQFWKSLSFPAPKYSPLAWRVASLLNRIYYFRLGAFRYGTVQPILPDSEIAKLKAVPQGAGNILVGPHPGPLDAQLMFHLLAVARGGPAVFLMAAESYFGGTALRRFVLNRLGVIPVARGKKNPEAIRMMSELIANGWWGGIFPEGEVYFSREVMPMEYGTIRIAVEAALEIQHVGEQRGQIANEIRPIFLTPFAHVYFFKDPEDTLRRAGDALRELESHSMIAIDSAQGDLPKRLRRAADQLLENKAKEYGIPREEWCDDDRFVRTRKLREAVLTRLEKDYLGRNETGYARRRASRVRMACYERLADSGLSEEARRRIEKDLRKTRELILMTPFRRDYSEKHNDLEMWVEYLCRFRQALDMPAFNFGPQVIEFCVQTPIDVHPMANEYRSLESETDRLEFLHRKTEDIRKLVQSGIDAISRGRRTMHIAE